MISKVTILFAFAAIFISIEASSIHEVITEETHKVDALREELNKALTEENKKLDNIRVIPKNAKHEIKEQLDKLDDKVKAAKKENKDAKAAIELCNKQQKASTKNINLKQLSECKGDGVEEAGKRLAYLGFLNRRINKIIPTCVAFHFLNADKAKTCIENEIKSVQLQIQTIRKQIEQALDGIDEGKVKSCVDEKKAKIDDSVAEIEKNLDECLAKATKKDQ